jgi:hypothetical protein
MEAGGSLPVVSGAFDAGRARDWELVQIKLPYLEASQNKTYELTFSGGGDDSHALGVPLYEPVANSTPPVVISDEGDVPQRGRFVMDLTTEYAQ